MTRSPLLLFAAAASFLAALFLQWAVSPLTIGIPAAVPPFAVLVSAAWLWILPMPQRLWYAGVAGVILDTLALPPFGTLILLFFALSLAAGGLKRIFASRDSYAAKTAGATLFCVLLIAGVPAAWTIAGYLYSLGL